MIIPSVIVFGATGGVGLATALTAREKGAPTVFLAMRNTQKPIPGLSREQEHKAGYERVQADLAQPETVRAAVERTGAKRAFIYMVYGTSDHMRSTVVALKAAGIEYVVVLSTIGVDGDIRSVPPSQPVSYEHAQVEMNLDEIFGPGKYVAVRPGYFASNVLWYTGMVRQGEVKAPYPEARMDWITPTDIGRVCGGLLTTRASGPNTIIPVFGPKLIAIRDAIAILGRALGKDVRIKKISEQEEVEWQGKEVGTPEHVVRYSLSKIRREAESDGKAGFYHNQHEQAVDNIRKYGGREPTTLEEWVLGNKGVLCL